MTNERYIVEEEDEMSTTYYGVTDTHIGECISVSPEIEMAEHLARCCNLWWESVKDVDDGFDGSRRLYKEAMKQMRRD